MISTELLQQYIFLQPDGMVALNKSGSISGQLISYQAAALYYLFKPYNKSGNNILEIGTRLGYSASIISQACPLATVITMESSLERAKLARKNLVDFKNVTVQVGISWDELAGHEGPYFSAIFVDGDHRYANKDAPWFNWLVLGGLILFHDYTKIGSIRVVQAVDAMAIMLGRLPDVKIIDNKGIGMAGFYRREGENVQF